MLLRRCESADYQQSNVLVKVSFIVQLISMESGWKKYQCFYMGFQKSVININKSNHTRYGTQVDGNVILCYVNFIVE